MKTPVGEIDPSLRTIHIWGGGVAGLLMAHFFSRAGFSIELYEKSSRLGGKIQSYNLTQGIAETGPNAIFATAEIEGWLISLGLKPIPATRGLKRRLWNKRPLPPIAPLTALPLFARIFKRAPAIHDNLTVADFFRPLLGDRVESLLSPALQGVYACGADKLTVTSLWPDLKVGTYFGVLKQLKGPKARSVSFAGGMQEFIDALARSITGKIHLNHTAPFIYRPNTLICTDAHTAAELLENSWPKASTQLKEISYLPLSSATVLTPRQPETDKTFGYLFPRASGVNALGVLFNQEIFPHRAGMTFIYSDAQNVEEKINFDMNLLGWPLLEKTIYSWTLGLPLYNKVRREKMLLLATDSTRPKNLVLFGNYVAGISLRDMIQVAQKFTTRTQPH